MSSKGQRHTSTLGKIGDPRAAPLIVDAWKANLEEAATREKRSAPGR